MRNLQLAPKIIKCLPRFASRERGEYVIYRPECFALRRIRV